MHPKNAKAQSHQHRSNLDGHRHTITGQATIMPEDDMTAYRSFCQECHAEFAPKTFFEKQLTQTIADTQWRLNRARAYECNLLTLEFHENGSQVDTEHPQVHAALTQAFSMRELTAELSRMSLYEQRLTRVLYQAMDKLEALRKARREREQQDMQEAVLIHQLHQAKEIPFIPSDHGFQVSLADIEAALRKSALRQEAVFHARC